VAQNGLRVGHSLMHAITDVISSAYNNVNNNNFTGFNFLDIKHLILSNTISLLKSLNIIIE